MSTKTLDKIDNSKWEISFRGESGFTLEINDYNPLNIVKADEEANEKKEEDLKNESALTSLELHQYGFISYEKWRSTQYLEAMVSGIDESGIVLDCLIDGDELLFEERRFDREYFTHFHNLTIDSPIIIKIRRKPGTLRFDFLDGKGVVNTEAFKINDDWDSLSQSGLGEVF